MSGFSLTRRRGDGRRSGPVTGAEAKGNLPKALSVGRVDRAARPSNLASIKEKPRRENYPQQIAGVPAECFVRDVLCAQDERMDERDSQAARLRKILEQVPKLAAEYYQLTGKPLGVTGKTAVGLGSRGQQ